MIVRVWTPDEDAVIRKGYGRREPLAKILARLSGRTMDAMKQRARKLGYAMRAHWTAREDQILRMEWGVIFSRRTLREKLPGRTWCAIARRAQTLRLGSPAQGLTSIKAAARATGYSIFGLLGVLTRQGVTVKRHVGAHQERRAHAWHLVDMIDVEAAIAKDLREAATTETIADAARRYKVTPITVRRKLLRAGVVSATRRGLPSRIPPAVIDAAMRGEFVGDVVAPVPVVRGTMLVRCSATTPSAEVAA